MDVTNRLQSEREAQRAHANREKLIERSPLADAPAEDPTGALRLYQSDFMIRDYGFSYADLPFDEQELLSRD